MTYNIKNNLDKEIIYFDNAATSWPKPDNVIKEIKNYLENIGGSPGRSGHKMSINASRVLEDARESVSKIFNGIDTSRIIFTKNVTEAINVCLFSLLEPGHHVITSSVEHNSVMRPLRYLESSGASISKINCFTDGCIDPDDIKKSIKRKTKLIVLTHANNVTGTILPIKEVALIALERNIPLLIDCAQTAGSILIDIDLSKFNNCILAFTGHKSLFGPTGTGGMCIGDNIDISPLIYGGTGSKSDEDIQPNFYPDKLESGTINISGLVGLKGGIDFINDKGIAIIRRHEEKLVKMFIKKMSQIENVTIYGPKDPKKQVGIISFNLKDISSSEVGFFLDKKYNIMSRIGLHCNPNAHETIGTFPSGTVRFGFSYFNSLKQIEYSISALKEILNGKESSN